MNLETRNPGEEADDRALREKVIGAAIHVHRELGPGFLESIYEEALGVELRHLGLAFERQKPVPVFYRGQPVGEHRVDLLIEKSLVIELKAIANLEAIHFAVLRSYLKALGLEDALLLNFASTKLTVRRVGREFHPRQTEELSL
ncbi:MAG: GxxExxY protein [Verrucomicrobiota bacterium]|nr:GxxExxY protein [Verrucomicrobiota bacterium]